MIVINLMLFILVACVDQVLDLNISKGPELAQSYRSNIIEGRSILSVYNNPENKENILEALKSFESYDYSPFLNWIKNKDFLKELVFIVKKLGIEMQNECYEVFNTIYVRGYGKHPIQEIYYCFIKSVCYHVGDSLAAANNEFFGVYLLEQVVKSKPIYLTEDKLDMSLIKQLNIEEKEVIEQIEKIRISLDSMDELLEKITLFLNFMPPRELEGKSKENASAKETVSQISFVYGKLQITNRRSEPLIKLMNRGNAFLFESLPYLKMDFLENISSSKEEKIDSFFKFVSQEYHRCCRYRGQLEKFIDNYLKGKDRDYIRKYCKKLVNIFYVHDLARRYLERKLEGIRTLKELFELFKENVAKVEEEKITFSITEYIFGKTSIFSKTSRTAIDDVFWLLSDLLSISDLRSMTLADGKLIHEYLALNHPEHLVTFFYNLRDSLHDDKDSIFNLEGRGPNFRILLLNKHGIKKFREIDKELYEKIGKDVLIFYDNDPLMMLVELFKKYAEEYIHDKEFELGSILIEYCRKLFSEYLDIFKQKEFNLFIELSDKVMLSSPTELDSYIEKISKDILLPAVRYPDSQIIDMWASSYAQTKSKVSLYL